MSNVTRTNALRGLVQTRLLAITGLEGVYYMNADPAAMYPHVTFTVDSVDLGDLSRQDYVVDVDVWDKGPGAFTAEEIADLVEDRFTKQNLPQDSILPTFYLESRRTVLDEDKTIRHIQIEMVCQNYEV